MGEPNPNPVATDQLGRRNRWITLCVCVCVYVHVCYIVQ